MRGERTPWEASPLAGGKLCVECAVAANGFDDVTFQLQDLEQASDGRFLCPIHLKQTNVEKAR